MKNLLTLSLLLLLSAFSTLLSQTATLKGVILDTDKKPVVGATISYNEIGTQSDSNGVYQLSIPSNTEFEITIAHIGFKNIRFKIKLAPNQVYELNPILKQDIEQITEVILSGSERKDIEGLATLDPETIRSTPSANAGVEGLLKLLPGVSSTNELSTQYSVRGGNYDENLVYVNDIEVYRPFLVRSGQQEGLSFVNSDLVRTVDFSAGGFQAKFGDKLSSVLDITYKRPTNIETSVKLSLLGASVATQGVTKNKKLSGILGFRYRDNSMLVEAKQTETNFNPRFADVQTFLTYTPTSKVEMSFLGNLSLNNYSYEPLTRQTNFGTVNNTQALLVYYQGQEEDRYTTSMGAVKTTYRLSDAVDLKLITSVYHTKEQEYYDILAQYELGTVNNDIGSENLGEIEFSEGIGSQLTHARNDLDALFYNIEHKGNYHKNNHQFEWGVKYTFENIKDRIQEYEIVDSAGFSIRPPINDFKNDQPYTPYTSPLLPFNSVRAQNDIDIQRISGYLQYSIRETIGEHKFWSNIGSRFQHYTISGDQIVTNSEIIISPRAQVALQPDWKADMLFRISGGLYYQPPMYRELRDLTGTVNSEVKAQKSVHIVLGNDYSFLLWNRPFKLSTELYYKELSNVNAYTVENVRIRYAANNNARAYAQGIDLRLNGEFVTGTESWVSLSYLKTEENQNDRGYIARPTDQRIKVGVLFQDYVPTIPNLKMYLNMVYQTGVPGGSPSNADPYEYQNRLPDYRRADLGISYVQVDANQPEATPNWLKIFNDLSVGFEIYNVFNNQNSITNTFVRDASSQRQYAIPNYLTARTFNVKLAMKF
ncbi:carboxypeptidase-like regulatory domain-containing protein [Aquimarina sp. 2-A2]|uniref:carboxypeptidase-like regulatory domain-containing protein n=1 Tax=Aquimarina sp. 2-A2 TaxID=3382644 RepID=UPI00387F2D39